MDVEAKRFMLIWTGTEYKVSLPGIGTMEVVSAAALASAQEDRDRLREALRRISQPCQDILVEATKSGDPWKMNEAALRLLNLGRDIADNALKPTPTPEATP